MTTRLAKAGMIVLLAACSEGYSETGGIRSLADMGQVVADESCLDSFAGPLTRLDRDYGYGTTKIATWPDQARFDARGGRWTSRMNGYAADGNRDNTAPLQFGLDWGTNIGDGRRDLWSAAYDTAPQASPFCLSGGLVLGTQPVDATWGETKRDGGGYAISINGKGAVVERVRIHNHHDGLVPYRSDGFVLRHSWLSYIRDDCIENDGHAAGSVQGNLFDGCYVFYSGTNGVRDGPAGAGAAGSVLIAANLIRMQNMPGPYARRNPLGDRSKSGYGGLIKTRGRDARVPALVLRDNVFAFEEPARKTPQIDFDMPHVRIADCANNTILWLGSGDFPGRLPRGWEACFTVISGDEAQARWDRLRREWLDAHPEVARL